MKKLISLLLAAALCVSLTGCLNNQDREERKAALDELNGYTTVDYTMKDGSHLEQTVIYDKNNIKVTILGIKEDDYSTCLWVRLENGGSRRVRFSVDALVVDGWEITGSVWLEAGKGGIDRKCAYLDTGELRTAGLAGFAELEVNGTVMDGDYNTLDTVSAGVKNLNSSGTAAETAAEGQVLCDENDVYLEFLGVTGDRYTKYLQFYMRNDRESAVYLRNDTGVTAGAQEELEVTGSIYEQVGAGHKRMLLLWVMDQEALSELPLRLNLELVDADSYTTFDTLSHVELNTGVDAATPSPADMDAGQVLYDRNGVKLVYQGLSGEEDDAALIFLAQNSREEEVVLETDEGITFEDSEGERYELTEAMEETLEPDSVQVISIAVDLTDLEEQQSWRNALQITTLMIYMEETGEVVDQVSDLVLEGELTGQSASEDGQPAEEPIQEETVSA